MISDSSFKPVIVVPAYKRAPALRNLFNSINSADFPGSDHVLIISLEGGSTEEVKKISKDFRFKGGEKIIRTHNERLGLKGHIYECADYAFEYGSVIILEEDLSVAPEFYHFSVAALESYEKTEEIAGISLYAQRFNETAQLPFEPMPMRHEGYFMQLACSWGQVWSAKQWQSFKDWLEFIQLADKKKIENHLPSNIQKWPDASWKKEFNNYLLDTEKYFFYPYKSYSTNNSYHGGENSKRAEGNFQVPLVYSKQENLSPFTFPDFLQCSICYDMYMEQEGTVIPDFTGLPPNEVELDLYGTKPLSLLKTKKYCITSKEVGELALQSFSLNLKPLEWNLKYPSTSVNNSLFHLIKTDQLAGVGTNPKTYIKLAHYFSYNRIFTKRFQLQNLIEFLRHKILFKT